MLLYAVLQFYNAAFKGTLLRILPVFGALKPMLPRLVRAVVASFGKRGTHH